MSLNEQLVLDQNATIPSKVYEWIIDNNKAHSIYKSPERYSTPKDADFELAKILLGDFDNQDVVNALIYWRKKRHNDLRLNGNYYSQLIDAIENNEPFEPGSEPGSSREKSLEKISEITGVKFVNILRYNSTPAVYYLDCLKASGQEVRIKLSGEELYSKAAFTRMISLAVCKLVKDLMKKDWRTVLDLILINAESHEVDPLETEKGYFLTWIKKYLGTVRIADFSDLSAEDREYELQTQGYPFKKDGRVYISLTGFQQYLKMHKENRIPNVTEILESIGAESRTVHYDKAAGDRTTITRWRLPENL